MDPPSYGRGPKGEIWKIEESVYPLVQLCAKLLNDKPLFFLINSYTTGLQPAVLTYMISTALKRFDGKVTASEDWHSGFFKWACVALWCKRPVRRKFIEANSHDFSVNLIHMKCHGRFIFSKIAIFFSISMILRLQVPFCLPEPLSPHLFLLCCTRS